VIGRRAFCAGLVAAPALAGAQPRRFDAVVQRSGGTHRSLGAALAAAPPGEAAYRILLGSGRWQEKLTIVRPNVEIVGADRHGSIVTSSVASGHERPQGGQWGTYGSATLSIEAPGVALRNLTVENGFDYIENMRTRRVANAQAVALLLGRGADRSLVERVDVIGHQDSFYLRAGRALVRDCTIAGSIDFIFGGAAARFEGCEIRTRLRPGEANHGYVAAPSTPRGQRFGLVFGRCALRREPGVPDRSAWLGRPWRAGGDLALTGAAAFLGCWMDGHIRSEGWTSMTYRSATGATVTFQPGDARFAEYRSTGPGAVRHPARPQLSPREAAGYSRAAMFGDWRPA
jgi:pectinesterase